MWFSEENSEMDLRGNRENEEDPVLGDEELDDDLDLDAGDTDWSLAPADMIEKDEGDDDLSWEFSGKDADEDDWS